MNQTSNNYNFQNNSVDLNNNQILNNENMSYNQPMSNNLSPSNNIPEQNYTYNNISPNSNNNKNKILTIAVIAIVIVLLLVIIVLLSKNDNSDTINNESTNNTNTNDNTNLTTKNTASYGETLKIYEMNGFYNFEIKVLSIEENYVINEIWHSGECLAIKVNIKNNSSEMLSLYPIGINLLDTFDNKIESFNNLMSLDMSNAILGEIPSGQSSSGYLYFFHISDDGITSNIESSDIFKIELQIIKNLESDNSYITGDYENYYLMLK